MEKNTTTRRIKKGIRTLFNPGVGCCYCIENVETGEKVVAVTLCVRDVDQKPWRSPKNTPPGEEFFKMKTGKKKNFTYYKFMNSILHKECLSDDGKWRFTGEKPDGTFIPLVKEKKDDSGQHSGLTTKIQKEGIKKEEEKKETEQKVDSSVVRQEIMGIGFSNSSVLEGILDDNTV